MNRTLKPAFIVYPRTFGHEVLLREERGGTFEIYLEENGYFSIFVDSTTGKSTPYNLTVKITQSKITDI